MQPAPSRAHMAATHIQGAVMIVLLINSVAWVSILTLTVLMIALGLDNIAFLAIAFERLFPRRRRRSGQGRCRGTFPGRGGTAEPVA